MYSSAVRRHYVESAGAQSVQSSQPTACSIELTRSIGSWSTLVQAARSLVSGRRSGGCSHRWSCRCLPPLARSRAVLSGSLKAFCIAVLHCWRCSYLFLREPAAEMQDAVEAPRRPAVLQVGDGLGGDDC